MGDETYDLDLLEGSLRQWGASTGLREVYGALYRSIESQFSKHASGAHLDIGAGIGVSKQYIQHAVTSDVVNTPYVDLAMSAYDITLNGSKLWANIFAVDVLHHLMRPLDFFRSASGVLESGGRIVLIEPAATAFGRCFYRIFHHEPIAPDELSGRAYVYESNGPDGEFANMGMGVCLFEHNRVYIESRLESFGLKLVSVSYRDLLAYPLTGGYSKPQMLPTAALRGLLHFERYLPQWLMKYCGLRMMIVLERIS